MKKILMLLFCLVSVIVNAATYYVSTTGSNAANGLTISTPWQTLQYAADNATTAGDIIALKKGDNWSSTTALSIHHGGATGNPIVWDGSLWGTGTANAIISASGDHPDPSGSTGGAAIVCVTGCKNVTFQNTTLNGNNYYCYGFVVGGDPSMAPSANQNDEANIILQDCTIMDTGGGSDYCIAVFIRTWNNDMNNIRILRNTVTGSSSWGIGFYLGRIDYGAPSPGSAFDCYIGYNTVINCGQADDGMAKGIGLSKACTRMIIEHNTITQGTGHCVGGISLAGWEGVCPTGIVIRYNDIQMSDEPALITEAGYPMQADIYYNRFFCNTPVYAVVWIFPPSAASYSGGYLRFYNNVIASNNANAFRDEGGTANFCTLRNNILINTHASSYTVIQTNTLITHSNNIIWRTGAGNLSCVVDQTGTIYRNNVTTWEPTAVITDPLLVNYAGFNWHLQSGSPAINAGTNVSLTADYDNVSVANPPEIGMYEYGVTPPPGTTTYIVVSGGKVVKKGTSLIKATQ